MAHIICDIRPDGTATYTIPTPRWDVVQDGAGWRVVVSYPAHPDAGTERSAPLTTAVQARAAAGAMAQGWLRTMTPTGAERRTEER